MPVHVHHLNCGTLRPLGGRLVTGGRLPFLAARLVCHCLLVETGGGLVLIDSGFGLADPAVGDASAKLSRARRRYTRFVTRARLDPAETAVRQIQHLGYDAQDVTDVVLTHLDSDHAGGLRDFPRARVHVDAVEHGAATAPRTALERLRYWSQQWAHGPRWELYPPDGEPWLGLDGVRELRGLPGLALVSLPGHSRGHAGVALRTSSGWLLHAGDAYLSREQIDPANPRTRPGLARFQQRFDFDSEARRATQARLRELRTAHGAQLAMICSHDPVEFDLAA